MGALKRAASTAPEQGPAEVPGWLSLHQQSAISGMAKIVNTPTHMSRFQLHRAEAVVLIYKDVPRHIRSSHLVLPKVAWGDLGPGI